MDLLVVMLHRKKCPWSRSWTIAGSSISSDVDKRSTGGNGVYLPLNLGNVEK